TAFNNAGGSGGGIYNNGSLTVINSLISNNRAGNGNGAGSKSFGGGIANNSDLTIINSTVTGNITGNGVNNGGGIFSVNNLTMYNTTVTGNASTTGSCCLGHGVVA